MEDTGLRDRGDHPLTCRDTVPVISMTSIIVTYENHMQAAANSATMSGQARTDPRHKPEAWLLQPRTVPPSSRLHLQLQLLKRLRLLLHHRHPQNPPKLAFAVAASVLELDHEAVDGRLWHGQDVEKLGRSAPLRPMLTAKGLSARWRRL